MSKTYDFAIVGAGCAGLSMAVELASRSANGNRIALIDPRRNFEMDRLWCFWNVMPHRFSNAVRHYWHRWKVRHNGREVTHQSSQYPYHYIPADAFYRTALDVVERFPTIDLLLDTRATDLIESADGATITTTQGRVDANVVFDGRNDPGQWQKLGCLLQHYAGQRIHTTRPIFDPDTVTLMDFDVSQRHGISFVYVLPFSPTDALVEPTVFSYTPHDTDTYRGMIRDYLRSRFGVDDYEVSFEEQGIIPMTTRIVPPARPSRIIPIGTLAGMVRASTGYGFLAIQKWNRIVAANALGGGSDRLPRPQSKLSVYLDRIFLSYLEAYPSEAPGVFFRLFRHVSADRLVRFLTDQATPLDIVSVITSMPKLPFVRQAVNVAATARSYR